MEFKNNFGFGCMRLPMKNEEVDLQEFSKMVDIFMENGFNYFDTAHGYIKGKSETAIKECLTKRYKREDYILVDKISGWFFKKEEDIDPYFNEMLEKTGVDYFDILLMHTQNRKNYDHFKECRAYEKAFEYKEKGLTKMVGISFHDSPEFLDKILTEYPQIEVVQIQFNYLDTDNPSVESLGCYEVCLKHNKPVIVMEPVKGGRLVNINDEAKEIFSAVSGMSPASYAIRYAAGFENVKMVLSGMSNVEQMLDNISFMKDFKPLNERELKAIADVKEIINKTEQVPCTSCLYCVQSCPKKINIPKIFEAYNKELKGENGMLLYVETTKNSQKASECIKCGKCEFECPQFIDIRRFLNKSKEIFE
ncbi:MAG: 4Fe-4S dicluster domain-containing protein [Clostridiales bacterium]|nr:4Fe-4S dicluster domain-containing protein [Clostridiales bacterium]